MQRTGKFFSAYDLAAYTKGSGEYLGLHSQTIQAINVTHAKSRKQFKKAKLNWRSNHPIAKRQALGWIPFKKAPLNISVLAKAVKKPLNQSYTNPNN